MPLKPNVKHRAHALSHVRQFLQCAVLELFVGHSLRKRAALSAGLTATGQQYYRFTIYL